MKEPPVNWTSGLRRHTCVTLLSGCFSLFTIKKCLFKKKSGVSKETPFVVTVAYSETFFPAPVLLVSNKDREPVDIPQELTPAATVHLYLLIKCGCQKGF